MVRKKPPEGTVGYGEPTYERLIGAAPEPLESSFAVSHAMMLNVINRPGDCWAAMRQLLTENDEPPVRRRRHVHTALSIYRGLLGSGVVERLPEPDDHGRPARLTVDLQPDFALNQPLSPFALAAFDLLDRGVRDVPPRRALGDRGDPGGPAAGAVGAAVEGPRRGGRGDEGARGSSTRSGWSCSRTSPIRSRCATCSRWATRRTPAAIRGCSTHELKPKSVARDLSERSMTFTEYVAFYGLARAEGIVLRYLADAYKALRQTVPEARRTEQVADLIAWLGELVRQVDSSLLEEWERLRNPDPEAELVAEADRKPPADHQQARLPGAGPQRAVPPGRAGRPPSLVRPRRAGLRDGLDGAGLGGRAGALLRRARRDPDRGERPRSGVADHRPSRPGSWRLRQILDDPAGDHDWAITAEVDLAASDEAGEAVVTIAGVGAGGTW